MYASGNVDCAPPAQNAAARTPAVLRVDAREPRGTTPRTQTAICIVARQYNVARMSLLFDAFAPAQGAAHVAARVAPRAMPAQRSAVRDTRQVPAARGNATLRHSAIRVRTKDTGVAPRDV